MDLVREIVTPTSNAYVLNLPDDMVGEEIEVIAFKTAKPTVNAEITSTGKEISDIRDIFRDNLIDLSNFKFDRDEANNYDD